MKMNNPVFHLYYDPFGVHQQIIKLAGRNKRILEIGCAGGYMSHAFIKHGCSVTGVEIDSEVAKKSQKICHKLIVGDIENQAVINRLKDTKFEVIIIADVLEHLKTPHLALARLVELLDKNGKIIISVPNIGFLTNRWLHLLGRFDYTRWGIMDENHLRFFTKKTILQMVDKVGLKVDRIDYVGNFTQLPLYMQTLYPLVGKRKWWRKIEQQITRLWPEGLAVQFLVTAVLKYQYSHGHDHH